MRNFVERDLIGIKPEPDEYDLLVHAFRFQTDRHNKGQIELPAEVLIRFGRFTDLPAKVLHDGMGFEVGALLPIINSLEYLRPPRHCTGTQYELGRVMCAQLRQAGEKYIDDYLDAILEPLIKDEVGPSFFEIAVD